MTTRIEDSLTAYYSYLPDTPILPHEEIIALAKKGQEGDQTAFERIVLSNLRLAFNEAHLYHRRAQDPPPIQDLCDDAVDGLLEGVRRFDPDKGTRLTTYATYWIRRSIKQGHYRWRSVRVPYRTFCLQAEESREVAEFFRKHGRKPTVEEAATALSLTPDSYAARKETLHKTSLSYGDIVEKGEMWANDENDLALERLVWENLLLLHPRERAAVVMRHGIRVAKSYTVRELEPLFGTSRGPVRALEKAALAHLEELVKV